MDTGVPGSCRFHGEFKATRINPWKTSLGARSFLSHSNAIALKLNKTLCEFNEEGFALTIGSFFRLVVVMSGRSVDDYTIKNSPKRFRFDEIVGPVYAVPLPIHMYDRYICTSPLPNFSGESFGVSTRRADGYRR